LSNIDDLPSPARGRGVGGEGGRRCWSANLDFSKIPACRAFRRVGQQNCDFPKSALGFAANSRWRRGIGCPLDECGEKNATCQRTACAHWRSQWHAGGAVAHCYWRYLLRAEPPRFCGEYSRTAGLISTHFSGHFPAAIKAEVGMWTSADVLPGQFGRAKKARGRCMLRPAETAYWAVDCVQTEIVLTPFSPRRPRGDGGSEVVLPGLFGVALAGSPNAVRWR
jgi:hypothetical protein